jgi:hypothetical protein
MNDKLCFVQFMHPGGEHEPDAGLSKEWNTGEHKRKFLKQTGRYLVDGRVEQGEMLFWGEWEPESQAQRIDNPTPQGPRYIHKPYYVVPESYHGLQNTDPFVFGEPFHYTGCQQRTRRGATQLRYLSRGTVILFGSYLDHAFLVDTVFVVDDCIDHSLANYRTVLAGAISEGYEKVTIFPWYAESSTASKSCVPADRQETWRLYFGASYDSPLHGMFSVFPCLPYKANSEGFARPRINMPGMITNNLYQGKKSTEQRSLDDMKMLWDQVTEQVKGQGLALGVHAEMPERRDK